jgi:hypothetical protein
MINDLCKYGFWGEKKELFGKQKKKEKKEKKINKFVFISKRHCV